MKRVKMLTLSAGPNGVIPVGQIVEVDDKEAKELVEGGYAEAVEEPNHQEEEKPADEQPEEEEKPKRGSRK
jgi:hypothetical protein